MATMGVMTRAVEMAIFAHIGNLFRSTDMVALLAGRQRRHLYGQANHERAPFAPDGLE
jgi:hypothetical protein